MARRVRGQGSVSFRDGRWRARLQIAPGDRRERSFATEREAWDWIADLKSAIRAGAAAASRPAPPTYPTIRFDDACRFYKTHRQKRWKGGAAGGSAEEFDSHVKGTLIPHFKKTPIGDITPAAAQSFVDLHINRAILHRYGEKKGKPTGRLLSPTTVNKYIRIARAVFKHAVKMGWVASNPFADVERDQGKRKKRRSRTLRLWELQAILATATRRSRLLLTFLAFTGLRRTETARCSWPWLDLVEGTMTVLEPKVSRGDKDPHVLPLAATLLEQLRAVPATKRGGFVFPGRWREDGSRERVVSMKNAIRSACVRAGVDPTAVSHHSFRYAFSTLLEDLGAPRGVVRALLRHDGVVEQTDTYMDPTPEQLSAAIAVFEGKVMGPRAIVPLRRVV